MIIVLLVLFGLCLGSFVNALVWRLHKQQNTKSNKQKVAYSITVGRSMCVHCGHQLGTADLLPVISWVLLGGKCRYCRKKISWQYPVVELIAPALFVLSYIYWPEPLEGLEIVAFVLWLVSLTGLLALVVYDLRWMLLPNKIILPLYAAAGAFVLVRMFDEQSLQPLWGAVLGILIGGGLFYVLFQISDGRWIGGGDVKLGFLLGALVGGPMPALMMLFFASLIGSIASLPLILGKKVTSKTKIPFGPFLILAAIIVMLFDRQISSWYTEYFLP